MSKFNVAWKPNAGPQTAFLAGVSREILYGGAAGGSKTESLMVLPFYRCHNPKHKSIIFRRTAKQLKEIIDRQELLYPMICPGAKYNSQDSRWVWPSGAITEMGYMEHEQDRFKFKTFEYDMVLFDELTSFTEKQYLFLFSRNRSKDKSLPAIMRGGTNPGDVGHQWVYERFIANREPYATYQREIDADVEGMGKLNLVTTQQFIPAKLADNPMMADRESYIAGLKLMGDDDASAYLDGDWRHFTGQMFRRLPIRGAALPVKPGAMIVRSFDYGGTDPCVVQWWRIHLDTLVNDVLTPGMHELLWEIYQPEMTVDVIATQVHGVEARMQIRPILSVGGKDMFGLRDTGTASGRQSIAMMLQQRGVWLDPANNDRVAGWAKMQSLLQRGRFYVRDGVGHNLIRTLPNLVRDPIKNADLKDRQEDHAAECARYAIMAVPERGLTAEQHGLYVPPPEIVTEQDPVFRRIMQDLTNGHNGSIFEGIGAGW